MSGTNQDWGNQEEAGKDENWSIDWKGTRAGLV